MVYFWAPWSRESVELLPSIHELSQEFEGVSGRFVTACLEETPADGCPLEPSDAVVAEEWVLPLDFERMLADYGVEAPPALVMFRGTGKTVRLSGQDLTPAALADLLEGAVSPPGTQTAE